MSSGAEPAGLVGLGTRSKERVTREDQRRDHKLSVSRVGLFSDDQELALYARSKSGFREVNSAEKKKVRAMSRLFRERPTQEHNKIARQHKKRQLHRITAKKQLSPVSTSSFLFPDSKFLFLGEA